MPAPKAVPVAVQTPATPSGFIPTPGQVYRITRKNGVVNRGTLAGSADTWLVTTKEQIVIRILKVDVKEIVVVVVE